ncbi:GDSL esterase/lipase-like [Dorcoceras hygrometricum]|uniref:GDSL esterase/lipase-like n=1 Tax=Dorcoceras hygrometricum TaxID=472368 RepID=A0A2Z7C621_9LAMI|nr:GDSL esterase/lipase-like [Dorcoceras hygrometricum]
MQLCQGETGTMFPSILIFGDSTVDAGNNNYITTLFRANHPPYGLHFPGNTPTGRFSDGKLVPDMLASMQGIKETVPPFLQPNLSNEEMLTGVSFASAGSGYDEMTTLVSRAIPISNQLGYFKDYIKRVENIVGEEKASKILSSAVVIISAGTNDFVFNYYDLPTRSLQFSVNEYQHFLLRKLHKMVKELYYLGCRKMVVSGLPPVGCLPIQRTAKSPLLRSCIDMENKDAESYNDKLKKLLPQINAQLRGSKILYADIYNPMMDMIKNPQNYGKAASKSALVPYFRCRMMVTCYKCHVSNMKTNEERFIIRGLCQRRIRQIFWIYDILLAFIT